MKNEQQTPNDSPDLDKVVMWEQVCRTAMLIQEIERAHNARGIFYKKGRDGRYHSVRRSVHA